MKNIEFTKQELEEIVNDLEFATMIFDCWFGSEDYNISSRYRDHDRIVEDYYEALQKIRTKLHSAE